MICDNIINEFPSYLQDLFQVKRPIRLIYMNKTNVGKEIQFPTDLLVNKTENEDLEVIGNPLEIDLSGDETLPLEKSYSVIEHWSENESTHFPLDIQEARNYLNTRARNRPKDELTFVICDGDNSRSNPRNTVIIGIEEFDKKVFTCTVNILGCFPKSHEKLSLSAMEQSHRSFSWCRKNMELKIDYIVTFKYLIFGSFIQNIRDVDNFVNYGSVCLETSINKKCSLDTPFNMADSMRIILQVIPGHRNSTVYFLWEDLMLVNKYLKILRCPSKQKPETKICEDELLAEDIYNSINEIMSTNLIQREVKTKFTLNSIRQPNIIDKLWNILKKCPDLITLRNAFHYFFEELAQLNYNFRLREGSTSHIATIINGILDGKLAVPSIDYTQALEFLIELGAEKLKDDYQMIIKHFYVYSSKAISSKWSELESKLPVEDIHRKTRITHVLKDNKTTITNYTSKLEYLGKLHVITEYVYLVKNQTVLNEDTFHHFCERICKSYLIDNNKSNICEFKALLERPVFHFDMDVNTSESKIVEGEIPDFCSVKMKSVNGVLETQSVYVLSKYMIFPPNIYNNYEIVNDENTIYYAFKMESQIVPL